MRRLLSVGLMAAILAGGCSRGKRETPEPGPPADPTNLLPLRVAEYSRDIAQVTRVELSSRRVEVRRHATRVLSRIGDARSLELLQYALHDEDREVVAWAAFGMGRLCSGTAAREATLALVSRAGTMALLPPQNGKPFEPLYAIATALGRCATDEAEAALRSWLPVNPEVARQAALGLDTLSSIRQRLDAPTIVALLDVAERYHAFAVATLPLARLPEVEPAVARRLVKLAPRLLETSGEERRFVIRALERAGSPAIAILERIVQDDSQYRPAERAEALRVLATQGEPGQRVLGEALSRVTRPDQDPSQARFLGADWAVVFQLLSDLTAEGRANRDHLIRLAQANAGSSPSKGMEQRLDWMRCRAARLLAGDDWSFPLLESCASLPGGRQRKLAKLQILSQSRLRGKAERQFESMLEDDDVWVRMAALRILPRHDEYRERAARLTLALADSAVGVVATAAELLARTPELALVAERSNPELVLALERAMARKWPEDAIELRANLLDAVGAVAVLSAKAKVVEACRSQTPRLRERAEAALRRLGEPNRRCDEPTKRTQQMPPLPGSPVTLAFQSDVGELELRLDPTLAPFAVERLLWLAKSGFFENTAVHRVVPGFVVQLGDKSGDGYGGAGLSPLPCEPAPLAFASGDVGMALSGSDSGSSQFFVTLGPYPQLGNEYTKVGRAGPGWDRLAEGDIIRKVEIVP